jgi:hypothetical protein
VVSAWADQGTPLPVAVVVSIFDDVCASLEATPDGAAPEGSTPDRRWSRPLALEHVVIDEGGRARLLVEPDDAVGSVSRLLYDTLAAGGGDGAVPAAVRPLIGHGLAEDPLLRPPSTEPMRAWLRSSLGPPALRDEVLGCCGVIDAGGSQLETPSLVEEASPPVEVDLESLAPRAVAAAPEPSVAVVRGPEPSQIPELLPRPVVRHEPLRRRPISLPAAPEARVGGAVVAEDSEIELPTEGRAGWWMVAVLALSAVGLVAWLLGLIG